MTFPLMFPSLEIALFWIIFGAAAVAYVYDLLTRGKR